MPHTLPDSLPPSLPLFCHPSPQAYDAKNNPKPLAQRLLTAFGVQAACNSFDADKHLFREPASKALPQAVADAEADVLVRCPAWPVWVWEVGWWNSALHAGGCRRL